MLKWYMPYIIYTNVVVAHRSEMTWFYLAELQTLSIIVMKYDVL